MLARGPSDMTIRISDEGGGVPREFVNKIFDFGFRWASRDLSVASCSAAPAALATRRIGSTTSSTRQGWEWWSCRCLLRGGLIVVGLAQVDRAVLETSPMAGLGFGLPVSRLYAQVQSWRHPRVADGLQYFGGDVKLYSVEVRRRTGDGKLVCRAIPSWWCRVMDATAMFDWIT